MAEKDDREIKIFSLNRIKFNELYNDALNYIKASYKSVGQTFNTASPFGQLLKVVLHLGRMIFYYIEDSITGLNIRTAYRPDQIRGIAQMAGHDAARPIAARGAVRILFQDIGDTTINGNVCYIPNKTKVINKVNGYDYVLFFGAENARITMQAGNYVDASIVQGKIKMQYVTSDGTALQSYNFAERNLGEMDQFYVNIYVNSEPWEVVSSLLDLGFNQKGVVVRSGLNGGIDIFFGNGDMGAIPVQGATIVCEYLATTGGAGNVTKEYMNGGDYWQWNGNGLLPDGTLMALQGNFKITCLTDVIFGTESEDLSLTQLIAPHTSRSFVLANETNYRYFFKRMNMFSDVEIIRGSYSVNGTSIMKLAYDLADNNYKNALSDYNYCVTYYGVDNSKTVESYKQLEKLLLIRNYAATKLTDNTYRDNTVYILLVPDIKKRISAGQNYFTCDEGAFYLSTDEQQNILNLINASGQRIMTVENRIILPKVVRFAINVQAKIWDTYDEETVYSAGLTLLSNYFINYDRKDIIPLSDIISIFENDVEGIDSVRVQFVADVNNQDIYGEGNYGIDQYGDVVLNRTYVDANGQLQTVRDMMPIFRGGFTTADGVEYSANQTKDGLSAYNLTVIGKSSNRKINLNNYTALT